MTGRRHGATDFRLKRSRRVGPKKGVQKRPCISVQQEENHEKAPRQSWGRNQRGNIDWNLILRITMNIARKCHVFNCMHYQRPKLATLVLLALLSSRCFCNAESTKPDFSPVRMLIKKWMDAESVPSIAIAVTRRGQIVWEEGFGWADRENRIPATENTPYYVASVSKTFTATAVMILNERKQLDLDHPVNDYLGKDGVSSPRWNPKQATVRRVATHTARIDHVRSELLP